MSEEKKVGLSSPWVAYYREIVALFGDDPDIKIEYYEDENTIKMKVQGQEKADAITELLPPERKFGNIVLKIEVIPANSLSANRVETFQKAFEGNPAFSFVASVPVDGGEFSYVVFKNKVVQFYNDNLSDYYGNRSALYQDIARDVFGDITGVWFCTDRPE